MWFEYWSRMLGIPYREYIVMTTGEIEDLAALKAVDSGMYNEVKEVKSLYELR